MQTFLTDSDFNKTARSLDNKRLFKQLLENYQLLRAGIIGPGFANHPARVQWRGYESFFMKYCYAIWWECKERGIEADDLTNKVLDFTHEHYDIIEIDPPQPVWYTDPVILDKIVTTHRANLYLKDPTYYTDWADDVNYYRDQVCCKVRKGKPNGCDYFWPSHLGVS